MSTTSRFGGISAMIVGILSVLYAIFYLLVMPQNAALGTLGSLTIFAIIGFFSLAAYVALYRHLRQINMEVALWGLMLGAGASIATLLHGTYQAMLYSQLAGASGTDATMLAFLRMLPSPLNPLGLMAFGVVGIVSWVWGRLMLRSAAFGRLLGVLALVNAVLLITLFIANVSGIQPLVLLSGGLTSVIVGPIWWIMLGRRLLKAPTESVIATPVPSAPLA